MSENVTSGGIPESGEATAIIVPRFAEEPVAYAEWVRDVYGHVSGEDSEEVGLAEEGLLEYLRPIEEGDPTGYTGAPNYVSGDADLEGRAALLVDFVVGAAWRLFDGQNPCPSDPAARVARPRIFAESDGRRTAVAVGIFGPREERRVAFELEFDLRDLVCRDASELRGLHAWLAEAVGRPFAPRAA